MKNFIGKYFADVVEYFIQQKKNKLQMKKVSDNRYIFHLLDQTDRELFEQNIKGLQVFGNPIYPDSNRHNHYVTVTYYPDNDKIIVKDVHQQILWRHVLKNFPGKKREWDYVKERAYYERHCNKIIITKQGILSCFGKHFRRVGYYNYNNYILGYTIGSYLKSPENVFNRILKDINLFYRPDMAWTYVPSIYKAISNSLNSLKTAKKIHKLWNPNLTNEEIDAMIKQHMDEEHERYQEEYRKHLHQIDVDDLPF